MQITGNSSNLASTSFGVLVNSQGISLMIGGYLEVTELFA